MNLEQYSEFVGELNSGKYETQNIPAVLVWRALDAARRAGDAVDHAKRCLVYGPQEDHKREAFHDAIDGLDDGSEVNVKAPQHLSEDQKTVFHGLIGAVGEGGEIAGALADAINGAPLDLANVKEELGDMLWYIQLACRGAGFTLQDVINANAAKLMKRYKGTKFSLEHCNNRNYDEERSAMSST